MSFPLPPLDTHTRRISAIAIFDYLFLGSDSPTCLESGDVNNSGAIDTSDGIAVLTSLFPGQRGARGAGAGTRGGWRGSGSGGI